MILSRAGPPNGTSWASIKTPANAGRWGCIIFAYRPGNGLPERNQFNFFLTLRGLGATTGLGTQIFKRILGPILQDEQDLPWS